MEQEGTSHAQQPNGNESVVSFSAASFSIPAGTEDDNAHPPIRKVRGLTPPGKSPQKYRSPSPDLLEDSDPDFERLYQNRRTKKQLKNEVQSLTEKVVLLENTLKLLKQHVGSQATSVATQEREK